MDRTARLAHCFAQVFPGLSQEDAVQASVGTLAEWDSLATLNLLALIQEEFGVTIDLDELDGSTSFRSLLQRIETPPDS